MDSASINAAIGRRIRKRRLPRNMSQAALAASCGVSYQQVQKYETAESSLSAARAWIIANVLGIAIDDLYDGHRRAHEHETSRQSIP